MRTPAEVEALIDRMFPRRVYVCEDAPADKRYLVQFYTNPTMTLLASCYGPTPEAASAKERELITEFVKNQKADARKAKPKYPDTAEGRLERVLDNLLEIFSAFTSEITSEELDT